MERKHVPESENKLIILYALRRLGPATAMQLLQFLVEQDLMNYFTMQLNLADMEEQGQIISRLHPLGSLMELTDEGAYAIESFEHRIPVSRRNLIDREAAAWQERFRQEQLAPADSFSLQDGSLCLRLRLLEGSSSLMDILLTLPGDSSFTFLQARWRAAAQAVYNAVTLSLAEGFTGEAPAAIADGTAAIQQTGHAEWLLSLADRPDKPAFTLLLPLADKALARYCAARWPDMCERLRAMILRELRHGLPE